MRRRFQAAFIQRWIIKSTVAKTHIRQAVIRSLSAVGALKEAQFYAELFASQAPERFALIVLDPRCLKNPLLEALVSDLRILSDLDLAPVLLIGAMQSDTTSNKFQTQRLHKALDGVDVRSTKLNMATYGLIDEIRKMCSNVRLPILEMTERRGAIDLDGLVSALQPAKVIFLQPSGGISRAGKRIAVVNIDDPDALHLADVLTAGQNKFVTRAKALMELPENSSVYIMASPLNLLAELFTIKGSGTLMRRGAKIRRVTQLSELDTAPLVASMEAAFKKPLKASFLDTKIKCGFVEENYRGGALFTQMAGLPYLSKFWVIKEARGEGIARDIWDTALANTPVFFWRSRIENPFNEWYMRGCDGMQIADGWRVFWKGLTAPEVPGAIIAASSAPEDFMNP